MITNIKVGKLYPHPKNPRKDLGDLSELIESIKANGILQNLTVVPLEAKGEQYRVVIGHRRCAAAVKAGLKEVPCIIADMDEKTQVATMLLENIQRSDLTVFEQAQGFQMMFDFGETIKEIAKKTGFSKTTIQSRKKLMEFDQDKLKAAVDSGATLMDFAEMDKIHDLELRNSVLEKFGTSNYKWDLKNAIDKEKAEKNAAVIVETLQTFATKIDEVTYEEMKFVERYWSSSDMQVVIPEDADEAEYYYLVSSYNYFDLYIKRVQTEEEAAEDQERLKQKEKKEALDELTKRAYELRKDFVKNYSGAKKNIDCVIEYCMRSLIDGYVSVNTAVMADMLGVTDENGQWADLSILEKYFENSANVFFVAVYCGLENGQRYYDWRGEYSVNEDLNEIYDFLIRLGYKMSDDEKALQDGTHELFMKSTD